MKVLKPTVQLYDYQKDAIKRMHNGCILCGGVGSGKSITALGYYYETVLSKNEVPLDLYIITTARKRDTLEWVHDLTPFFLSVDPKINGYSNKIIIDSWNNLVKYAEIRNGFFIFDEQRAIGKGTWAKTFIKIAKNNQWIMLSATPGDNWTDYIPVFVANGFYKNRNQFLNEHAVYSMYSKYPKIDKYLNVDKLIYLKNKILVSMDFQRTTVSSYEDLVCDYDRDIYRKIMKTRWNPYENQPIINAAELCFLLRKVVNSDKSRLKRVLDIVERYKKVIIFYNYDYELNELEHFLDENDIVYTEWNGHKHEQIALANDYWAYLVQYFAGAEGWNCIQTNTMIFYSQSYSYKTMSQAAGRIDRLNTPFSKLYYFKLMSNAPIDLAIRRSLNNKKDFNEGRFVKWEK